MLDRTNKDNVVTAAHLIPGWCYIHEMALLYELFKNSRVHVEIGTFCGKCMFVTACAMENGSKVIGVDAYDFEWVEAADPHFRLPYIGKVVDGVHEEKSWAEDVLNVTVKAIKKLVPDTEVALLKKPSIQAAIDCKNMQIDSIFIDGNHSKEGVSGDIRAWYPMLKPGGIMVGHDYWTFHPGVMEAVEECFGGHGVFPGGFRVQGDTRVWIHQKPEINPGTPAGISAAL